MRAQEMTRANDDEIVDARLHYGHDDELLSDFRRRMDSALEILRAQEEAAHQGDYF